MVAQATAVVEGLDLEKLVRLWPAVLEQVRESGSGLLSQILSAARPVAIDVEDAVLEVGFPASAAFNKRKAEAHRGARPLRRRVAHDRRRAAAPQYVLLDGDEVEPEAEQKLSEDELIELMRTEFDAEEYCQSRESGEAEAKEAEG